jgi:hypothetical protein
LAAVEEKWKLIQKAAEDRVDADGKLLKAGDWRSLAWSLERAYPAEFARPEIALNLAMQNNVTQNYLSISITGEQAREIEAEARPIREKVAQMISRYRPALGNGEGEGKVHDVEATSAPEPAISVITHQGDADARNQNFWRGLVSDPQSLVAKETAIFAIRMLLLQTQGYKAHRAEISFDHDPVTVEELFGTLERLLGGAAGWQLAQKLGGY